MPLTTTSLNISEVAKPFFNAIHYLWLDLSKLRKYLYKILAKTLFVGKSVVFLPSCHSTNEEAAKLQKTNNSPEGTIVITNNQIAGVGQRGNSWESEQDKNLTFSILLKPTFLPVHHQFQLNIAISLGILDFLNSIHQGFLVKWPNDLYFENKKIAGILIQNNVKGSSIDNSIVGIGLNCNQKEFKVDKATSLSLLTGNSFDLDVLLEQLSQHLEWRYIELKKGLVTAQKSEYINNLLGFNKERQFKTDKIFSGTITGITPSGKLQIEGHEGIKDFDFKEIEFL